MINPPNQDMQDLQPPSGKLILPAPPGEDEHSYTYTTPIRPEQLIRRQSSPAPAGLVARLRYFWHKDPAYRVLTLAIALVLVASIVLVAFGASTLFNNNGPVSSLSSNQPSVIATAIADPVVTPPPNQGSGPIGTQPTLQPTPGFRPTPGLQPSPSPINQGPLVVQITSVPTMVANNSKVHVGVSTNQPGVTVKLQVIYNVTPFFYNASGHTGASGNASLPWNVKVALPRFGSALARVQVIATDSNGQQVASQTVTVAITGTITG